MNRREFVHITALGSAAGVMSFTGLGLVWNEDESRDAPPPDAGTESPSDTVTPLPTDERSPRSPTRTSSDDASPSPTATDSASPTATTTESPQGTEHGTEGTPTSSTPGQTGTPEPSQNVESDFTPLDDDQEVYVKLENGNSYTVDITITITWGYDDGTNAIKKRTVQLDPDAFWSDSIYRDAEGRTVERWGYKLDVEKP